MLDRSKVKLMTKLALYEQTQGKEDFKISEYYRKDYVGLHSICSFLWVTVGYICVWMLILLAGFDLYNQKHKDARQRVKMYNHDLIKLLKLYEKEKQ